MDFLSKTVVYNGDVAATVDELRVKFADFPVKNLLFFASHVIGDTVAGLIKDAFPDALTLGCSSYAEICEGRIHSGSLTAMAFAPGAVEMAATVAENITADPGAVDNTFASLEHQLGARMIDLDFRSYFGMILFDGASYNFELALEKAGDCSNVIFVGGHASDDFSMRAIRQYLDGKTYRDSAIMAVVKPRRRFSLLKTQSVRPLGPTMTVTKADSENGILLELDGKPAAEVYARAVRIRTEDITHDLFQTYSFGIMAGDDPYIRAISRVLDNGGLQLFFSVVEGQRLAIMQADDTVATTRAALERKRAGLGGVAAIIDFDCAHRALNLQAENREDDYARLFDGAESAGFFTFGEAYIATVNQTSVMALFGDE